MRSAYCVVLAACRFIPAIILINCLLLLAGCATGATAFSSDSPSQGRSPAPSAQEAQDPALLDLMMRILDNRSGYAAHSQASSGSPELLVGALPDSMPFDLPLPEGAIVAGSLVQVEFPPNVIIFLDAPQPAQAAIAFYRAQLERQGFSLWQPDKAATVFSKETQPVMFCHQEKNIQLSLAAYDTAALTDIRLTYSTDPRFVSCTENIPQKATYAQELLPALTLPPETRLFGRGKGGGYEGWAYATREFTSVLSPAEIEEFLRPQLQAAGWELTVESQTEAVAWSRWMLTEEKGGGWNGVLIVTAGQGAVNSRVILFQIEQRL